MTTEERIRLQKQLVQETGKFYDKKGMQPIAGRIMGLLTIMDKEQFTFDEIVEELQISKSSASNALKLLETADVIEYLTIPGDRKRYFQVKKKDRFAMVDEHGKMLTETRDFLKKVLHLKADKQSANSLFINDLIGMLDYFLDNFQDLKKKYTSKK